MRKWALLLLSVFFPTLVLAEGFGALDFSPPASDISVQFLGDLFGTVEGVLSGTSGQMAGKMFSVLNSAVLALAGLLVAYTLIVSTMNTAHEGEVLGKKWSSIWIPIRVSIGLALLLPRGSGYCTAQVFVMWIVVQGVGAGDKIWNAVLDYMGTGGVIVAPSQDTSSSDSDNPANSITAAAGGILSGQLCMLTMQYQFEKLYTLANDNSYTNGGKCSNVNYDSAHYSNQDAYAYSFCNYAVPDFLSSVDFSNPSSATGGYYVNMPNFPSNSWSSCTTQGTAYCSNNPPPSADYFYSQLNGMCGSVYWLDMSAYGSDVNETVQVAIGQLYTSLQTTAQTMLDASPFSGTLTAGQQYSSYGYPRTNDDTMCSPSKNTQYKSCTGSDATSSCESDNASVPACTTWGGISGVGTIFSGSEISTAVDGFVNTMSPTMRTIEMDQSGGEDTFDDLTGFIDSAKNQGWIMAGSFFFNLVNLNDYTSSFSGTEDLSLIGLATGNACDAGSGSTNSSYGGQVSGNNSSTASYETSGMGVTSTTNTNCTNVAITDVLQSVANNMPQSVFLGAPSYMLSTKTPNQYSGQSSNPLATLPVIPVTNDGLFQKVTSTDPSSSDAYTSAAASNQMCVSNSYKDIIFLSTETSYLNSGSQSCVEQPITNTSFAFYNNANAFYIPTTNTSTPSIDLDIRIQSAYNPISLDGISVSGGSFGIPGDVIEWVMNKVLIPLLNQLMDAVVGYLSTLLMIIITPPLTLLTGVFDVAMEMLTNTAVNPILSLASMGSAYINGIATLWYIIIIPVAAVAVIGGGAGAAIGVLLMMTMPIVFAWYAIMFVLGCICAYYIPFLPYMIFTFASIGWFIGVIEAMTAAPLVALGVATPEGHEAFGKSAQAIMIILNVFLRPGLMIVGYIFGFALSYVSIWLINTGFTRVQSMLFDEQNPVDPDGGTTMDDQINSVTGWDPSSASSSIESAGSSYANSATESTIGVSIPDSCSSNGYDTCDSYIYTQWSSIFYYFFMILIYTNMMVTVVQKSYELIHYLPDKILRWLSGGQQESLGSESAGMTRELKQAADQGGQAAHKGVEESQAVLSSNITDGIKQAKGGGGGGGGAG